MEKSERFGLVLSPTEKKALYHLANQERLPAAAVVRRLIYREAQERGLWPAAIENQKQVFSIGGKR